MSTQTATAKNGQAKPATEKKSTVANKRKTEDLKKTIKGSLIVMARGAFELSKRAEYEGIDWGMKKVTDDKGNVTKESRNPYGIRFSIIKENGRIDLMDEKSDEFGKVRAAAKDALADMQDAKYSGKVKAFLKSLVAIKVVAKERGFNAGSLEGLSL